MIIGELTLTELTLEVVYGRNHQGQTEFSKLRMNKDKFPRGFGTNLKLRFKDLMFIPKIYV